MIFPTDTAAETVQIPETITLPVKTMTVFQSARIGANAVESTSQNLERMTLDFVSQAGFFGSSGNTVIKVNCGDTLQSLSEGELQTSVEVTGECIAKKLGALIVSGEVAF